MRYMLWICDDGAPSPGPAEIVAMPEFIEWERGLSERGIPHRGVRLRPPSEAVTVRVRGGETLVADGPFAETKEQIGGYEIIECADLDEAIEVAGGHPAAARYPVEIRPFWEG
ncbi:YciI family protein [Rugosimonospora africana]|uniref:Transcription initiation protein n=1 Tax=Rugosimonospora africana TaxID=556532 RepID=A0A8J3QRV3_9ACTN|nr:YciI family protein [Rugosimonospora africana]GIH15361.1 transcription initiation protein [Rugosimonospora africana]